MFSSLHVFDFIYIEFLLFPLSLKLFIVKEVSPSPILYVLDFLYKLLSSSIFLIGPLLGDNLIDGIIFLLLKFLSFISLFLSIQIKLFTFEFNKLSPDCILIS